MEAGWEPQRISVPTANHGVARARTLGVIIHSTRGGASNPENELDATINWFLNPASQASAHAVIDIKGNIYQMVDMDLEAWAARGYNKTHLQIELVQERSADFYSEDQYRSCAWLVRSWQVWYEFPLDRAHIQGHEEIPPGIRDKKSDPGKMWNWKKFMALLGG